MLLWLDDGNFVFLGYRGYDMADDDGLPVLAARPGPGLGLLRHREQSRPLQGSAMPGARGPALALTKAGIRSTVLRDAYLDEVSLLTFDMAGNPTGEVCFVGLFAPSAASRSVLQIPVIRDKVATVLDRFGFPPRSHAGKELLAAIEAYPRDELFHIDARRTGQPCPRNPAPPGTPQHPAVPQARFLWTLHVRPGVPSPPPLQHGGQAQHRTGTAGGLQLQSRRVRTSSQRVGHGPRVFPDPASGRRTARRRRLSTGAAHHCCHEVMGRGLGRGSAAQIPRLATPPGCPCSGPRRSRPATRLTTRWRTPSRTSSNSKVSRRAGRQEPR